MNLGLRLKITENDGCQQLHGFGLYMNVRKHPSDGHETWIAESLNTVTKDIPNPTDSHQTRPSAGYQTPDVLKSQAGKVTTKEERQGTPTQERQEHVAATFGTVEGIVGTVIQAFVRVKPIWLCYNICEINLG